MPEKRKKYDEASQSGNRKKCPEEDKEKSDTIPPKGKCIPSFQMMNIVQQYFKFQVGTLTAQGIRKVGESVVSNELRDFDVYEREPYNFSNRITALQFHPTNPRILGIGSKHGTVIIRTLDENYKCMNGKYCEWIGMGPGYSVTCINFNSFSPSSFLTSSIDGTVKVYDYTTSTLEKVLLNTGTLERWYCYVNASVDAGLVVAGDSKGLLTVLDKDYKQIASLRLHKKKIHCIDLRSWLLATASVDGTAKIWDIRKLVEKQPLHNMVHECGLNSAYFSLSGSNRLLTTDQNSELRVYSPPLFNSYLSISHPHRQFQHLTPIRAVWHPLCDLIAVGRYPDPTWASYHSESRSIDVFSGSTGKLLNQVLSNSLQGIISLNSFSSNGDILASGMGSFVPYWRLKQSKDTDSIGSEFVDLPPKPKREKFNKSDSKKLKKMQGSKKQNYS